MYFKTRYKGASAEEFGEVLFKKKTRENTFFLSPCLWTKLCKEILLGACCG